MGTDKYGYAETDFPMYNPYGVKEVYGPNPDPNSSANKMRALFGIPLKGDWLGYQEQRPAWIDNNDPSQWYQDRVKYSQNAYNAPNEDQINRLRTLYAMSEIANGDKATIADSVQKRNLGQAQKQVAMQGVRGLSHYDIANARLAGLAQSQAANQSLAQSAQQAALERQQALSNYFSGMSSAQAADINQYNLRNRSMLNWANLGNSASASQANAQLNYFKNMAQQKQQYQGMALEKEAADRESIKGWINTGGQIAKSALSSYGLFS